MQEVPSVTEELLCYNSFKIRFSDRHCDWKVFVHFLTVKGTNVDNKTEVKAYEKTDT